MKNTLRILAAATLAALSLGANAVGRLADITIHDRSTGRDLPVYWHEGRAYVVGKPGNEYEVRVANRAGEDLLAVMSVDGINVLNGETATPNGGGYVFSSWEQNTIRGWRKSMKDIAAFYFTSLGDSYAARTGRPDNVGVIGVALFQRKRSQPPPQDIVPYSQRPAPYPADQAASGSLGERHAEAYREDRDSKLGTGHGRSETSYARYASFERASSAPAETITIYYDSYRNLVARGVIRSARPYEPSPGPRPFPGFVPDPQG